MDGNSLMSSGKDSLRMSTNVFGLDQLFYMPLKAVIDANTQASLAVIKIIREYGFENDKSSENYGQLKMATFSYKYAGKTGQMQTMSISIPFITLIPLPLLEVKHAEIDFALKVLGQVDVAVDKEEPQKTSQNLLAVFQPDRSNDPMNLSLGANMNVNIKVGQSDLPGGIIQMLNLGQEATMGDNLFDLDFDPLMLRFDGEQQLKFHIRYVSKTGLPNNVIFEVAVEPSYKTEQPPFTAPIEILQGNLYGKASWRHLRLLPVVDAEFSYFTLRFSAGLTASNGFIVITSNYSKQLKVYYSINPM